MVWVRFALVSVRGIEGSGDANCFADAPICRPFCELRSSFSSLGYRERRSRPTSRGASSWRQSFEITFSSLRGVLGLVAARDQR